VYIENLPHECYFFARPEYDALMIAADR